MFDLRAPTGSPSEAGSSRSEPTDADITQRLREKLGLAGLIGESPSFTAETRKIPLVARCPVGVLITGETGTGKEVVARAIHYLSARAGGPFVPVNCGALPLDLVENELFGHERAAYTGASAARAGLVEEADGGTLFLDEVDSLPPPAQVKLLRFLQDREFRRLGSSRVRTSEVRVVAATNSDVQASVAAGRLRQDLFYRLNVVTLELPPLRDRPEDIPLLARHFLERYAAELRRPAERFSDAAMEALLLHDWPGNVRELEHVVQRALVLSPDAGTTRRRDLGLPARRPKGRGETFREAKARVVADFEKGYVERALAAHAGNISQAARAVGKNRRAFFELIRRHGVDAGRFRQT